MTLASRNLLILVIALFMAPSAFAEELSDKEQKQAVERANAANNSAFGAGIGMGIAVIGAGIGIGLIGFAALSGIARQPEQAGALQGTMYVMAGLVEGTAIIALLLCFVIAARIM